MSYLVLARKYRPQVFEDLVGQEHVATTLKNALGAQRPAHAYIFSGPRGCGKTTTARLLAKALNCAQGPTAVPCGQCPSCVGIASGSSADDVLEIDGASNRGIDQIRELRDTVKYAPARSRYRITIIDEAHQITDAGFNALLKTLEEPPAHAVFMLATTEIQKFPATILSRCQRFALRPISTALIQRHLEKVASAETLRVDGEALAELARAAHGSLRDALCLLDQVVAYSPQGATAQDVRALMGLLPRQAVQRFTEVLESGDPAAVLQAVGQAVEEGSDLFQLAHDLQEHWHQALLWTCGVKDRSLAEEDRPAGKETVESLERKLRLITKCVAEMRRSEAPRVTFELCALEISQKVLPVEEILERLETLEKELGEDAGPARPEPEARPAAEAPRPSLEPPGIKKKPDPGEATLPDALKGGPSPDPIPVTAAPTVSMDEAWTRLVREVGRRKPSLEHFLATARCETQADSVVQIVCLEDFQKQQVLANLPLIREILQKSLPPEFSGGVLKIQCIKGAGAPGAGRAATAPETAAAAPPPLPAAVHAPVPAEKRVEPAATPAGPAATSLEPAADSVAPETSELDPALKKVMKLFPGKLKKIDHDKVLE